MLCLGGIITINYLPDSFNLIGVTTVRIRVRVSSVNLRFGMRCLRLCQAERLLFVFTTTSTALLLVEPPRHSNWGESRSRSSNISGF